VSKETKSGRERDLLKYWHAEFRIRVQRDLIQKKRDLLQRQKIPTIPDIYLRVSADALVLVAIKKDQASETNCTAKENYNYWYTWTARSFAASIEKDLL
jgi:hypothetical protein